MINKIQTLRFYSEMKLYTNPSLFCQFQHLACTDVVLKSQLIAQSVIEKDALHFSTTRIFFDKNPCW